MAERRPGAVEFADTFNVRDLGGLAATRSAAVRHDRFFRGAALHRIRGEDIEAFRALGVRTVVDLRTSREIESEGAFPERLGIAVEHAPLVGNLDAIESGQLEGKRLASRYMVLLEQGGEPIRRVVSLLADPERGPLAVYCAAGKDRTGVVVAAVLSLLGVGEEEIVADYHLSEVEVQRMMSWLRENYAEGSPEHFIFSQPPEVVLAPPAEMVEFLRLARGTYGSFEAYAEKIGVTPAKLQNLRRQLLV